VKEKPWLGIEGVTTRPQHRVSAKDNNQVCGGAQSPGEVKANSAYGFQWAHSS